MQNDVFSVLECKKICPTAVSSAEFDKIFAKAQKILEYSWILQ